MPVPSKLEMTGFVPNGMTPDAFTPGASGATSLGKLVERATDTLPQTGAETLFTVSGGLVLLKSIVGVVTTVIQTQANNTKLVFDPDATGADVDLCAVLNISADVVGTVYTITGTIADAMVDSLGGLKHQALDLILPPGGIELNCAASNTGSVRWLARYVPLDEDAVMVATAI